MSNTFRQNVGDSLRLVNSRVSDIPTGTQDLEGSTTIRRTVIEHGVREVGSNIGTGDGSSATIIAISNISKQHEDERRELQELNTKLGNYLDRVQYLENQNGHLMRQLEELKKTWGIDLNQLQAIYGPDLVSLRRGIDDAVRDRAIQELQLKRFEYDISQISQQIAALEINSPANRLPLLKQQLDASVTELESLQAAFDQRVADVTKLRTIMENLINQLEGLKNELDNTQLERIMMENELQSLQEHNAFQIAIHQAQREELLELVVPSFDISSFYRMELARAISEIRQDFEVLTDSQIVELEEYYRIKTEQVREQLIAEKERKRLLANEGVIESMDMSVLQVSIKDNQNDLISLQADHVQLQGQFEAIISDLERIREEQIRERDGLDHDIARLSEEVTDQQGKIDAVLSSNVSLRFELSTYRRLLEVEENHMHRVAQVEQLLTTNSHSSSASAPGSASDNLAMKKMTVQKTARGPIFFESVDLDSDSIWLVNETQTGREQSFQNWSIHRQIDQQPEIVYSFPSSFVLRPGQSVRILSRRSPTLAKFTGNTLLADQIETWGQGQLMVTRLVDANNIEKAILTQRFQ